MTNTTIIDQIRSFLSSKPPLTVTSTKEIHNTLRPQNANLLYHTLREATQKISLGSATAKRRNTQKFYAVYLKVVELKAAAGREDVIFTLPGIDKHFIKYMASNHIKDIKAQLSSAYGSELINYWVQAAQLRSVDIIKESEKKVVIARDSKRCRLCKYIEDTFNQNNITIPNTLQWVIHPTERPRICHIISRSAVFWHLLEQVHSQHKLDIFKPQGVLAFKKLLASNELHSSAKYMVYLCRKHDNLVQKALQV